MDAVETNSGIWNQLYEKGMGRLQYPSEALVRFSHLKLREDRDRNVLDYGFGSGANLIHLARRGFNMFGVEVSPVCLDLVRNQCAAHNIASSLSLFDGKVLPFASGSFDAVVAWQVLYYNDAPGSHAAVFEIERVLKPGGIVICTMPGPRDVSRVMSKAIGRSEYESLVPSQMGARLFMPERSDFQGCWPGRSLTLAEFEYSCEGSSSHHFIVSYRKEDHVC